AEPSRAPCVVVFAMNLHTAADRELEFDPLRALGDRLCRVVARAPMLGFEIALTLPVKQSADKALERLLLEAPSAAHAGRLAGVYLLSRDGGLRDAIGGKLGAKKYPRASSGDGSAHAWTPISGKKGSPRQAPKNPPPCLVVANAQPPELVHAIDTPALAQWAHARPVELPPECTLQQLVVLVGRRPAVLTQVGLTLESTRGLARMITLAAGNHPSLGPCDPTDGLELCGGDIEPGLYSGPAASKAGPGALRLAEPRATTVRTLLPLSVALAVEGAFEIGGFGAVDDARALGKLSRAKLLASKPFKVRLSSRPEGLRADVSSDFGKPLPAWWLLGRKTQSERTLEGLATVGGRPFTVDAIADVIVDGRDRLVVMRAPFANAVTVELRVPLSAGQVGSGTVGDCLVAVLGREDRLGTALTLRCRPIQEVSDLVARSTYPSLRNELNALKQLPLVVPI
ncbi:MAG: hypothetical protein AB1Z98_11295, partial [Nannocystaceae bacterium]